MPIHMSSKMHSLKVIMTHRPIPSIPPQAFQTPTRNILAWIKVLAVLFAVVIVSIEFVARGFIVACLVNRAELLSQVVFSSSSSGLLSDMRCVEYWFDGFED